MKNKPTVWFRRIRGGVPGVWLCAVLTAFVLQMPAAAGDVSAAPRFFKALDDVPLMQGLREVTGQTLVFDKPEGRIIEVMAVSQGDHAAGAILDFYAQSLPQLGWMRIGQDTYRRAGESLRLRVEDQHDMQVLYIMVEPAQHGTR